MFWFFYIVSDIETDTPDPYQTDSGSNYSPTSETESEESFHPTEDDNNNTPTTSRKRVRNQKEWKINKRKRLRAEGKQYIGHKNKIHKERSLVKFDHSCRYKCNINFPEKTRQELFGNFYKLPTYDHQTAYLSSCIKKIEVGRKSQNPKRRFSTQITLLNKRVCKECFLKTFDITNRRFTSVCKKTNHLQMCEPDQRGKGPSKRKLSHETRRLVLEHIQKFPKYSSHYSRQENANTKYLSPDLTLKKM